MESLIKEATLEDIDNGLLELFIEGYRYHQKERPDIFKDLKEENLRNILINSFNKNSFLIIVKNNIIIGYLSYEIVDGITKKLTIDEMIIRKEYRKKGFCRMLMDKVHNIANNNKCNRIELNCWMFNHNALAMYEHMGFDKQRIIYEMLLNKED